MDSFVEGGFVVRNLCTSFVLMLFHAVDNFASSGSVLIKCGVGATKDSSPASLTRPIFMSTLKYGDARIAKHVI